MPDEMANEIFQSINLPSIITRNKILYNKVFDFYRENGDQKQNAYPSRSLSTSENLCFLFLALSLFLIFQNDFTKWGMYSTDLFTDLAVNIIQSHEPSKPLYLYLPHQAVHSANAIQPLQAPENLIKKFDNIEDERRRIYAAMVTALDDSVGKGTCREMVFINKISSGQHLRGYFLSQHS